MGLSELAIVAFLWVLFNIYYCWWSLNRCETGTFVHTGICFSFFVCVLSPLVWFFLWLPEEVLALLFLLHCENGDFSILMKDILWVLFVQELTVVSAPFKERFTVADMRHCYLILFYNILRVGCIVVICYLQRKLALAKSMPNQNIGVDNAWLWSHVLDKYFSQLLQAWEFLYHFFEVIGQETLLTFKDLEVGLSDMGLVVPSDRLPKTDDGNCNFLPKLEDDRVQNKEGLSEIGDENQIGATKLGEHLNQNGIKK